MTPLTYTQNSRIPQDMDVAEAVRAYLAERSRNRSMRPESVKTIRYHLWGFERFIGGDRNSNDVKRQDVADWLASLNQSPRTLRCKASAVRGLYEWLAGLGHVDHDPVVGIRLPRLPRAVPRAFSGDEVGAVLAACGDTRERLIVSLMVQEGMRAGEVSRVEIGDVDRRDRVMLARGKGGHERMLPLTEQTVAAMEAYLAEWPVARSGRLVRSMSDGVSPITRDRISGLVAQVMYRAGVKRRAGDGKSGHALRHTAASDVLDRCGDIRVVQEFLGHSSIMTTQVYLRRASAEKIRAAVVGRDYR